MSRLTVEIPEHLDHFLKGRCEKYGVTRTGFLTDLIEAFCVEEKEWMASGSRWDRKRRGADAILQRYSDKRVAAEHMKSAYIEASNPTPPELRPVPKDPSIRFKEPHGGRMQG